MLNEVLVPTNQMFFDWGYTAKECIDQLEQLKLSSDVDLYLLEEWTALSLETQSVAYYKHDKEIVSELIEIIAATILSIKVDRLVQLKKFPFLLYHGLRALLSQTHQNPEPNHLVQLYHLLPVVPEARIFDVYVMFQCFFGFENVLKQWNENYDIYAKDNGWSDYNRLQLRAAKALLAGRMHEEHDLMTQLDAGFERYVLKVVDRPLAAEWFPWLSWFIRSKV